MKKKSNTVGPGMDYHLHTRFCKHASGSLDAYVRAAEGRGLTEICFADHIPLPGNLDREHRMESDEMEAYLTEIEACRKKFPGMKILAGIEADYIAGLEPYLEKILARYPFDLVIMSVHFIHEWPRGQWVFDYRFPDKSLTQVYHEYFSAQIRGIKTGLFDIVGHLDLIKRPGHSPFNSNIRDIEDVLAAVQDMRMSIEINTSGIRKPIAETYPSPDIIGLVARNRIPVTPGSDAHLPEQVGFYFDRLPEFLPDWSILKWVNYKQRKIQSRH
jgi:histidinol-phosphatase (PHP family)